MSEDSTLDLRAPSESYLQFLQLGSPQSLPEIPLADFFSITDADGLKFWKDPLTALTHSVKAHLERVDAENPGAFYYSGPKNSVLENALRKERPQLEITELGSDPEEIMKRTFPPRGFFLLFSPNPTDSSFWSRELLGRVAKHFMTTADSYVLVDESLASLYWEAGEDLGTLRNTNEVRAGTLISLEPWSQGESSLTLINRCPKNASMDLAPTAAEMKDWIYLHHLWTREFHVGTQHLRLRTALSRNTRTFTEELREEMKKNLLHCTHWPKASHSVLLRIPRLKPVLAAQKLRELGVEALLEAASDGQGTDLQIVIPLSGKKTRDAAERIKTLVKDL